MKKILFVFLMSLFSCINFLQANIFEAIQKHNIEWVKYYIENDEENSSYNLGMTPLHVAVINNFYDAVVALVEANVDIDARDEGGYTPLYYATNNGNEKIADYLIEKKASVKISDKTGETSLHIAVIKEDEKLCSKLLKFGADPDYESRGGSTPRGLASPRIKEMIEEEDIKRQIS